MKPTYQTVGGTRSGHTAIAAPPPRLARGARVLLAALALAGGAPLAWADDTAAPPDDAPLETAASAASLLDLARLRLGVGDPTGARVVLLEALGRADVDADAATYLLGYAWEHDGAPSQAIALYDQGLARWPGSPLTIDRLFRRAESLAALEQPDEALETLGRLPVDALSADDRAKVRLAQGALLVEIGRTRRGLRALAEVLPDLHPDAHPWYQARARATLARSIAADLVRLHFRVADKRQARRLEARAAGIRRIEREVAAIAHLDEPEWVLDGVLTLGGALETLAHDLADSRRPRRLSDAQRAIYDEEVDKRVDVLRVKAARTYRLGVDMAERIGWSGRRAAEVEARHAALRDALDLP